MDGFTENINQNYGSKWKRKENKTYYNNGCTEIHLKFAALEYHRLPFSITAVLRKPFF